MAQKQMTENTTKSIQTSAIIQNSSGGNEGSKTLLPAATIENQHNNSQSNKTYQYSDEHYYHIADQMLRQLEQQYEQVHRHDKKKKESFEMEEKNQNTKKEQMEEQEENNDQPPDGYQNLEIDNQFQDINIHSDDSQQCQSQKDQIISPEINMPLPAQIKTINPENCQLVQVPPTPNSIFEICKSEQEKQKQKVNDDDYQKIKQLSLMMNIETPEWALDPLKLQNRIRQLFGKSSNINSMLKQ